MANALYPKAREAFLAGNLDWDGQEFRVILIDTADGSYNSSDEFLSSIATAARVATSGALTGKSVTNGTADAADVTISGVTGDTVEALLIYQHAGSDATSRLVAWIDTVTSGLPLTPNGGDVTIVWPSSGIFTL